MKLYDLTITYLDPITEIYIDLELKKLNKKEMSKQIKLMMNAYHVTKVIWAIREEM